MESSRVKKDLSYSEVFRNGEVPKVVALGRLTDRIRLEIVSNFAQLLKLKWG